MSKLLHAYPICTNILGHLHITPTSAAPPWKLMPWSSWRTVFVLFMPQEVCSLVVIESAKYWWPLGTMRLGTPWPLLCNFTWSMWCLQWYYLKKFPKLPCSNNETLLQENTEFCKGIWHGLVAVGMKRSHFRDEDLWPNTFCQYSARDAIYMEIFKIFECAISIKQFNIVHFYNLHSWFSW